VGGAAGGSFSYCYQRLNLGETKEAKKKNATFKAERVSEEKILFG